MRIPIGKVADHLGINVHHSTVIRWHQKGVVIGGQRIVLPAMRLGHRLYVDETDLAEFVGHLNNKPVEEIKSPQRPPQVDASKILDQFNI